MFIDEATIEVKGGDGGHGIVAFRREKYVPLGGPSGGDGGRGGDVVLQANGHTRTLIELSRRRHHKGEAGRHGEGSRRRGREGKSVNLLVPLGTQVFDKESGALLADLVTPGQTFVAARGGDGGRGNIHFSNSSRQAPRFSENGVKGEERILLLSLKILADVALIGLPNAGKSTLISSISAAHPKIANYPFTTLVPNLGVVRIDNANNFVAADIPGLIRGAHKGTGLGHQFLKHIERAPVFIHLLDVTQPNLYRSFMSINRELKLWNEELVQRPQLVALTKMDAIAGDEETKAYVETVREKLVARGCQVFEISAATGEGLQPLLWQTYELVKEAWKLAEERAASEAPEPVQITTVVADKPFAIKEIARFADGMSEWEASGGALERLVERFDTTNNEAALYVHRLLERHGVIEELRKSGVKFGDLVHVGKIAFAFEE